MLGRKNNYQSNGNAYLKTLYILYIFRTLFFLFIYLFIYLFTHIIFLHICPTTTYLTKLWLKFKLIPR